MTWVTGRNNCHDKSHYDKGDRQTDSRDRHRGGSDVFAGVFQPSPILRRCTLVRGAASGHRLGDVALLLSHGRRMRAQRAGRQSRLVQPQSIFHRIARARNNRTPGASQTAARLGRSLIRVNARRSLVVGSFDCGGVYPASFVVVITSRTIRSPTKNAITATPAERTTLIHPLA